MEHSKRGEISFHFISRDLSKMKFETPVIFYNHLRNQNDFLSHMFVFERKKRKFGNPNQGVGYLKKANTGGCP